MSLSRHLLRRAPPLNPLFHFRNCSAASGTTNHLDHHRTHEFLPQEKYVKSWKSPKDPKEAQTKLALLRREYAKKVKAVRKEYIREMEFQKLEKLKKDAAKKEALRIANEERKAAKEAEKKAKEKERQVAEEEFRKTLLKERMEKREYWSMKTKQVEEKKKEKNELLHRQSSEWIDESKLEDRILNAYVDTISL